MKTKKPYYKRKRVIIPVILIILLVVFRLMLPTIVKKYVNKTLANIPNYYGQVADIDISLWRGAYVIEGMYLNKVNAQTQVPFLDFKKTDISVQWKSLLNGKIVSEIEMNQPTIIYVFEDHKGTTEGGETEVEDWTKALTDIVPIDINRLYVTNGKIAFVEVTANPNIDLQMNNITLEAKNLRNVIREGNKLPSTLNATATSIGNGKVNLKGKMDLVKTIPDMDLEFSLEDADVTSLNDFTKHYAKIDFSSGTYGVYSEMAINDGYLKGYIKPILKDTKLIGKDDGFLSTLWEGFVGFFKFALKNQKKDTLATKVPIEGDLNNVTPKIWPTITRIFKNAWIKAFQGVTDDSIEFEDAAMNGDSKDDDKKKKDKKKKKSKDE